MAFWGRIIPTHAKCWHSIRMLTTNKSSQIVVRAFSNQVPDQEALIQEAGLTQEGRVSENEPKTFEELFKKSTFVALGNPKGKVVIGTIKKIVENNAYIDFGWKFPCVCPLPAKGTGSYMAGKKVRILIKELEMASKFLGCDKELSLNEADCVLLGLLSRDRVKNVDDAQPLGNKMSAFLSSDQMSSSQEDELESLNIDELVLSLKDNKSSEEASEESETKPTPVDRKKSDL